MKKIIFEALLLTSFVVILTGCKKEPQYFVQQNKAPVAYAGVDQTVSLPVDSVEFIGRGTDADGSIVNYSWEKISGPSSFIIFNPSLAITKVKSLLEGVYVFELKVTDNDGLSARDKVVVNVMVSAIDPCNGCWDY